MVRKRISPIDIHVGNRIRMRRLVLSMSQEKLGESLGISFQQVQKYEKGKNRIGAGRLYQISHILGVDVGFFFEQIDSPAKGSGFAESHSSFDPKLTVTHEGIKLLRHFSHIGNPLIRRRLLDLTESLIESNREITD